MLLAAALVFLLTQTIDLQHSHDGDLSLHPDCQICLKLGSFNDISLAKPQLPEPTVFIVGENADVQSLLFRAVPSPQSRAPPAIS